MYFTYIIRNLMTGKRYIGSTSNLERRLTEHNRGKTISTRYAKGSWKLVYSERYKTSGEALAREKVIKSYKGGGALRKLLKAGVVQQ